MCSRKRKQAPTPRPNKSRMACRALAVSSASDRHAHFMANLLGATPGGDVSDLRHTLEADKRFLARRGENVPLRTHRWHGAHGARCRRHVAALQRTRTRGACSPTTCSATPPYTRISRMIRDFASGGIVDGNKKVNLREVVEAQADRLAAQNDTPIQEIRHRELAGAQHGIRASYRSSISNTKLQTHTSISCSG